MEIIADCNLLLGQSNKSIDEVTKLQMQKVAHETAKKTVSNKKVSKMANQIHKLATRDW